MAKKIVKYMALLPLVRFGYPHREGQFVDLENNDKTTTMLELGYIVEASKAKKATEPTDTSSADNVAATADAPEGSTEETGA